MASRWSLAKFNIPPDQGAEKKKRKRKKMKMTLYLIINLMARKIGEGKEKKK